MSWQFLVTSLVSELEVNLKTPLDLEKEQSYEIGLVLFSVYNIIFNITEKNNKFSLNSKELKIELGAYEVRTIAEKLIKYSLDLVVDLTTGKSVISIISYKDKDHIKNIKPEYQNINELKLEFNKESFFNEMLGFTNNKYQITQEKIISNERINIMDSSLINITCNLVSSNFLNNEESNILYSFPVMSVPFSFKISEKPSPIIYSKINTDYISRISFKVQDENNKLLDFNKEKISLLVHLRRVPALHVIWLFLDRTFVHPDFVHDYL